MVVETGDPNKSVARSAGIDISVWHDRRAPDQQ
jgi:hypothetical protein